MEVEGQFLYTAIESVPRRKQMLAGRSAQAVPVAVHSTELQASPDELKAAILLFYGLLDEQQRRLFAGLESIRLGHGGDTLLGDFLGLDVHTVARGRQQLLDQNVVSGRSRRTGGGRSPVGKKRPTYSPISLYRSNTIPRALPRQEHAVRRRLLPPSRKRLLNLGLTS